MILIVGGCVGFRKRWLVGLCSVVKLVDCMRSRCDVEYAVHAGSFMASDNIARPCGTVDGFRLSRLVLRV